MANQWKNVRLDAGLHEDLTCEIARLAIAYSQGVPIAVDMSDGPRPPESGITMSAFIRRLLHVYQRERRRKEKSAAKKRRVKADGEGGEGGPPDPFVNPDGSPAEG